VWGAIKHLLCCGRIWTAATPAPASSWRWLVSCAQGRLCGRTGDDAGVSTRSPEEAYRALRRLARAEGRTTQQAFELYVHERFLARLANSRFAERLVLKGGMLLAALDARRATRDADMLARGIDNDMENLRNVVSEIAAIELTDGVVFDVERISLVTIRGGRKIRGHPSCRARDSGWCCLEAATRSVVW